MVTLRTLINRAKSNAPVTKTEEIVVDRDNVEAFLSFNSDNRKFSKSLASQYANNFLRGVWKLNGENFIFSSENAQDELGEEVVNEHIASAQHRLEGFKMAIQKYDQAVEAGTAEELYPNFQDYFTTLITTGVPHENVDLIDIGKARNHTDILFRSPVIDDMIPEAWNETPTSRNKWCKTLATAARLVWQRSGGKAVSDADKFDHKEMLDFVSDVHPRLYEFVTLVLNAIDGDGGNKGIKISPAYVAGLSYLACLDANGKIHKDNAEKISDFLDQVAQGVLTKGSPAHAITGFWNSLPPGSKNRDLDVVGPFVKALNAVLEDQTANKPTSFRLTKKEKESYKEFPQLLPGWDTASFEEAVAAQLQAEADKAADAEAKAQAKEEAKASKTKDKEVVEDDEVEAYEEDGDFEDEEDVEPLEEDLIPEIED